MEKTRVEITKLPDTGRAYKDEKERGVVIEAMNLLKGVTGTLLGSLAVSAQISNVLICIFLILLGPAFVIELLDR